MKDGWKYRQTIMKFESEHKSIYSKEVLAQIPKCSLFKSSVKRAKELE